MILKLWKFNGNYAIKTIKHRKTQLINANDVVYDCFYVARAKNIPISGPIFEVKAIQVKNLKLKFSKPRVVGLNHSTIFLLKLFVTKINQLIWKRWMNGVQNF